MPTPDLAETIDVRLVALVAAGADDLGALEGTLRSLAEESVVPALHICLSTEDAELRDPLLRLAAQLCGRHESSVEVSARGDFLATLRGVAARFPHRDVAVVAPGAQLPFAWDARLAKAAYAAEGIAAAVPLCDASDVHRLVDDLMRKLQPDAALVDRSAYCMGDRAIYEVPRLHEVCAYLRRDALARGLAACGEAPAPSPALALERLVAPWRARGLACVLCDYLYVGYDGPQRPLPAAPDLETTAFLRHHPLGMLRRAVNDGIAEGLPSVSMPGLDAKPVHLHVMHYWGGGLDKWVRDFGAADDGRTHMILATFRIGEDGGQRVVLYSDPAALIPVRTWDIARPVRATAVRSLEYGQILEEVLRDFSVEALVVSSLIGHSLEALAQPVKTLVVCHDFYPVCQAINPLFAAPCEHCTAEDLARCASENPLNRTFGHIAAADWDELRTRYVEAILARGIEMVVPSPSVARTLKQLEPRLREARIHVIPHGIEAPGERLPWSAPQAGEPLRLVVLGRQSLVKGLELLRAAAPALRGVAQVTLVGCGKDGLALAQECGWDAIESYKSEELGDILRSLAPHAGVLASIVPETFSYTLSELRALGIPPVATRLGSFVDRIQDGHDGFLFDPTPAALGALLQGLAASPQRLEQVARVLAAAPPQRSTREMVRDYDELLPLQRRAIARFAVGVGRHTALTEPYRHLEAAYRKLQDAYQELRTAYEQVHAAYDKTHAEFDTASRELARLRENVGGAWREIEALELRWHWWRAPEAHRLVADLTRKMAPSDDLPD